MRTKKPAPTIFKIPVLLVNELFPAFTWYAYSSIRYQYSRTRIVKTTLHLPVRESISSSSKKSQSCHLYGTIVYRTERTLFKFRTLNNIGFCNFRRHFKPRRQCSFLSRRRASNKKKRTRVCSFRLLFYFQNYETNAKIWHKNY